MICIHVEYLQFMKCRENFKIILSNSHMASHYICIMMLNAQFHCVHLTKNFCVFLSSTRIVLLMLKALLVFSSEGNLLFFKKSNALVPFFHPFCPIQTILTIAFRVFFSSNAMHWMNRSIYRNLKFIVSFFLETETELNCVQYKPNRKQENKTKEAKLKPTKTYPNQRSTKKKTQSVKRITRYYSFVIQFHEINQVWTIIFQLYVKIILLNNKINLMHTHSAH